MGVDLLHFLVLHVYKWSPAHALKYLLTFCRFLAVSRHLMVAMEPVTALALFLPELSSCRLRGSLLIYEEVGRQGQARWLE